MARRTRLVIPEDEKRKQPCRRLRGSGFPSVSPAPGLVIPSGYARGIPAPSAFHPALKRCCARPPFMPGQIRHGSFSRP